MKILILGAGKVGGTLAEHLAGESFDVTVVDLDEHRLRELRDRLDIRTVYGHASRPDVLQQADADDADMLIAVTGSDEVNMVACQVSYSLFKTPMKIARIRASAYLTGSDFFTQDHMPIDVLINPEQVVTDQIKQLLQHPGALQVLDFADGRVQLAAMRAYPDGRLVGQQIIALRDHIPNVETRVAAIFRRGQPITPRWDTIVEAEDEVFFVAAAENISAVMEEFRHVEKPFKRVMIAGGGNIGESLARSIESSFSVKVLEFSAERADAAAQRLDSSVVILGDATDRDLLIQENIERTDAFCAVTNDDEVNIMSSMMAKQLGVRQVMTLIGKPAYVDLMHEGSIDVAISPQLATTSTILTHVRRADVARVHSLRRGAAEAMEAVVHGNDRSSKVVGRRLIDLGLPEGTTIGALVRNNKVLIAHDELQIESEDHVILFLTDKTRIGAMERLFQVNFNFF